MLPTLHPLSVGIDYLSHVREDGGNNYYLSQCMRLVEEGIVPLQSVRKALVEGLRNRAHTERLIASTKNYFTEIQGTGFYRDWAACHEELVAKTEAGKEIVYCRQVIPAITKPFSI